MKIDKDTLATMQDNCLKVWNRLIEIYPDIQGKLNEKTANDLWFRTWSSVAYPDTNPNVIKDADGKRILEFNPDYDLYPCDSDDKTMQAALNRIYKYIQNNTEAK